MDLHAASEARRPERSGPGWSPAVAAAVAVAACLTCARVAFGESPDPAGAAAGAAAAAAAGSPDYPQLFGLSSRTLAWGVAQLHLLFGAFVLGVPIFACIVEAVGLVGGEARYDRLAREFTRLLSAAFSTTMALGGLLTFVLLAFYPKVTAFLVRSERPSFVIYPLLFFGDAFALYLYHYGWDRLQCSVRRVGRGAAALRRLGWWGAGLLSGAACLFWLNPAGLLRTYPWTEFDQVNARNAFYAGYAEKAKTAAAALPPAERTPAGLAAVLGKAMDGLRTPDCFVAPALRRVHEELRAAARAETAAGEGLGPAAERVVGIVRARAAAPEIAAWLDACSATARGLVTPALPRSSRGLRTLVDQAIAATPVPAALLDPAAFAARDAFVKAAAALPEVTDPAAAIDAVVEGAATAQHEEIERRGAALAARSGLLLGLLAAAATAFAGVAAAATHAKAFHLYVGVLLNLLGTVLMFVANSWVSFMMTPAGINKKTGIVVTYWNAFFNPLWMPLNLHRLLGNVAFGGLVCGAYAAVRYLAARTAAEREHYDWMGYVGNFIGMAALIPLPFAGYYLGREIYAADINMGMQMMGGTFSWTFIVQAFLIGGLFLGANYYLWMGIHYRSRVADRYSGWLVVIHALILISFAVWLTPRNIPLSGEEMARLGGPSHPILKFLGLMSGKLAAVNMMILMSFLSFLLYRRSGLGEPPPLRAAPPGRGAALAAIALVLALVAAYAKIGCSLYLLAGGTLWDRAAAGPAWVWVAVSLAGLVLVAVAVRTARPGGGTAAVPEPGGA
ncbi:MAG: cytochrome ubiquinol oxidase subunit I, partial [Planctomycetes bacterium]|nr:cytochrome ubiquinol oxidase subunit I [Planctomycetota bacterium]